LKEGGEIAVGGGKEERVGGESGRRREMREGEKETMRLRRKRMWSYSQSHPQSQPPKPQPRRRPLSPRKIRKPGRVSSSFDFG